jgi:hypothetical protein
VGETGDDVDSLAEIELGAVARAWAKQLRDDLNCLVADVKRMRNSMSPPPSSKSRKRARKISCNRWAARTTQNTLF